MASGSHVTHSSEIMTVAVQTVIHSFDYLQYEHKNKNGEAEIELRKPAAFEINCFSVLPKVSCSTYQRLASQTTGIPWVHALIWVSGLNGSPLFAIVLCVIYQAMID